MSRRFINLITLLILITVVYSAYRYFVLPPAVDETAGVSVVDSEEAASGEFLELLLAMKNISLTKKIFDNPIFRDRLQDFSRPLPDRLVGRDNPFAPLGVGATGTTTISERRATTTTATSTTATSTAPRTTPTSSTLPPVTAPRTTAPAPSPANNNLTDQEIQQFLQGDFNF